MPAALSDAASQFAVDVLGGETTKVALQSALAALEANTDIQNALKATIADVLALFGTAVLSNPIVDRSLGTIVTTLVTNLAGNPVIQAFIGDKLGAPYGGVVVAALATPGVSQAIGTALGLSVTDFLTYPGFVTAVTDTLNQFADAVLDGRPRRRRCRPRCWHSRPIRSSRPRSTRSSLA